MADPTQMKGNLRAAKNKAEEHHINAASARSNAAMENTTRIGQCRQR
ncbi:hypothetical protein ACHAC9_13305 [Massilia sp. CMS3.1]